MSIIIYSFFFYSSAIIAGFELSLILLSASLKSLIKFLTDSKFMQLANC